jgi:hypothetical protein
MDTAFKILSIYNTPYISTAMKAAPMSRIDDGCNDIALMTADKSRI